MEIENRDTLLAGLMTALADIVDHCRVANESFDDFIHNAALDVCEEEPETEQSEYVWKPLPLAFEVKLPAIEGAKKAQRIFSLFIDSDAIKVNAGYLDAILKNTNYKTHAILYNLHCYGLLDVSKKGWHYPFDLKITDLARKISDLDYFPWLIDAFQIPYPTEAGRQAFWAARKVSVGF